MSSIKFFTILIIIFSILVIGCIDQKPTGTPVPTVSSTPTNTVVPTIIPTIATPVPTPSRIPVIYKSLVDVDYGFYQILALNATSPVSYYRNNRTLFINSGDKIIFANWPSANTNDVITIISDEELWENNTGNLQTFKTFNHTFNETGTFTIRVKEFKKVSPLKIIVTS
jgi:hypothetical protein